MKKTIFLLAILSIIFLACNPLKPGNGAEPSNFLSSDSIPTAVAEAMIAHYSDGVVDKSLPNITKQTALFDSDLFKIFKIKDVTAIKLWAAAYLDTDTIVARRNTLTVLVQVKQGYNSTNTYYDIQRMGPGRLCPPPPGCIPKP